MKLGDNGLYRHTHTRIYMCVCVYVSLSLCVCVCIYEMILYYSVPKKNLTTLATKTTKNVLKHIKLIF